MINNDIIYNLNEFILNETNKSKTNTVIFNEWSLQNNIKITDFKEVLWFVDHIKTIRKMDREIIKEAQFFDSKINNSIF